MKTTIIYSLLLFTSAFLSSCGKDEPSAILSSGNSTAIINQDGSTSTGAVFSPINNTTFYLDYIRYEINQSHLEITGCDRQEIGSIVKPYATIKINGATYNTRIIRQEAFKDCKRITSVTIPNSVTQIGVYAFQGCSSLTSVIIPNSVTIIGSCAFNDCSSLTSVSIPNSVTYIGQYAFSSCSSLTSVAIPNSVTEIYNSTFSGCSSLTSVIIPNSVTEIGGYAFQGCSSLTSVTIPNSVTKIDENTFQGCTSLTSVSIPNSVTIIGSCAFQGCSSLTSVTIPESIKYVYSKAFYDCNKIKSVYYNTDYPRSFDNYFFTSTTYESGELILPTNVGVQNAKQTLPWSWFKTIKAKSDK